MFQLTTCFSLGNKCAPINNIKVLLSLATYRVSVNVTLQVFFYYILCNAIYYNMIAFTITTY